MRVGRLEVCGFRNLQHAWLEPSRELTVICGENGHGKTNLLEAIWLLTGAKSFRGAKDAELIQLGCEHARLEAELCRADQLQTMRLLIAGAAAPRARGRTAQVNGVDYGRAGNVAGLFTAVVFAPVHVGLIKGSPEGRRRFLDSALCQLYPAYVKLLHRYARQISQKNALLKQCSRGAGAADLLDVFDEEQAQLGEQISRRRQEYLQQMLPEVYKTYEEISGAREQLTVQYCQSFVPEQLLETIKRSRQRDITAGFCTVGPHREDFLMQLDGRDVRIYGSQGQQRSVVLALKMAEAAVVRQVTGLHPVMLLDDVLSELDEARQRYLLSRIEHRQTFVTACDRAAFARTDGMFFDMNDGCLTRM